MLLIVLILTAVGLLFGAGALLLFRYQCQLRVERQHELEKIYAVRSALNYTRVNNKKTNRNFPYYSYSGRHLNLRVKPVAAIFPIFDENGHADLDIGNLLGKDRFFTLTGNEQLNIGLDYEYGMMNETGTIVKVTSDQIDSFKYSGTTRMLKFPDQSATNGVKWWVNIGMTNRASWLQSDYGLRYCFKTKNLFTGSLTSDIVRVCIIRQETANLNVDGLNVGVRSDQIGCRHGWPLAKDEMALVFQLTPYGASGAKISFSRYIGTSDLTSPRKDEYLVEDCNSLYEMGLQIAGRRVYLFYVNNVSDANYISDKFWEMPIDGSDKTYKYFFDGAEVDDEGRIVKAPCLRTVIEVEAASDRRPLVGEGEENITKIEYFKVSPAYQYEVFIKNNTESDTAWRLATVLQTIIDEDGHNAGRYFSMRTYDTHGTSWKGFRKDKW